MQYRSVMEIFEKKIAPKMKGLLSRHTYGMFTRGFSSTSATSNASRTAPSFTQSALDLYKLNKGDVDKELDKVCFEVYPIINHCSTSTPAR